ncbi:MAG TPA: bifunctional DNA-formamidopyrimidine glycosylase/DNA-(apurinic or apyrimidinic site) lyase [Gemmatimonadales bacterium]|nr:bifunctional DNA-formamidopyrimidine glycosylase/DNA-(apurinic or apyrimidinic site) lyase [Gemmatimonadales bacterium]
MPELPEVETIVRDLRPELLGRTILRASLSHDDVLRGVTRRRLLGGLRGARIVNVSRRAKHAVLELDTGRRLVIQPGMSGVLLVAEGPLSKDDAKYAVLRAPLDDGRELVYRDVRRLGTLLLLNDAEWHKYDGALGPEPLDPAFTAERLAERLGRSRQAIKKVLMDQRYVVGVGNIYANEALFAARIDPSRPASRVTADEYAALHSEVRRILTAAIRSKGTTLRDYRTGTGEMGNFQFELLAYGREGEPCRHCGTRLTLTHLIDGRSTVFCHRCQH